MEFERCTISYMIFFSQRSNTQKIPIAGVGNKNELSSLIRSTFKGRFRKPLSLTYKDGVRIVVQQLDHIKHTATSIMNVTVYNKSVRQARIEVEKAIRKQ